MQLKMYSIRDAKADIFHPPFFKNTHGEAERDFEMLAKDPNSTIHKFPEDYDLWYLGTYDNSSAVMSCVKAPEPVTSASSVLNR